MLLPRQPCRCQVPQLRTSPILLLGHPYPSLLHCQTLNVALLRDLAAPASADAYEGLCPRLLPLSVLECLSVFPSHQAIRTGLPQLPMNEAVPMDRCIYRNCVNNSATSLTVANLTQKYKYPRSPCVTSFFPLTHQDYLPVKAI